jgi:hypothetical protein
MGANPDAVAENVEAQVQKREQATPTYLLSVGATGRELSFL